MLESTGLNLDPLPSPCRYRLSLASPPLLLSPHCCCSGSLQEEKRAPLGRHLMRRPLAISSARELILEEAQAQRGRATEQLELVNLAPSRWISALYAWRLAGLAHPCRGDGPVQLVRFVLPLSFSFARGREPFQQALVKVLYILGVPVPAHGGRRNALRGAWFWLGPWPFAVQAGQVWMFVCQRVVRRGWRINQSIAINQSINQHQTAWTHVRTRTHTHAQRPAASTSGMRSHAMPSCHISATVARQ
ncbi:hypothetical protein J3E68DRAFT_298734 [Trichoderma sp. SZMC 28012]